MKPSSARSFLVLAVLVYVLWVVSLVTMAAMSAVRPTDRAPQNTADAASTLGHAESAGD